ncbi:hemolysin family protein [Planosporangium sp. 12N6]|uniref:hemolysin family protein n=1 Tax=Planosporangium spinosum TaxID=3402278 RepID=UPI003CED3CA6
MRQAGDTGPETGDTGPDTTAGRARPRVPGPVRRALVRVLVRGTDAGTRWLTRLLGAGPAAGRERISEAELRDLVAVNTVLRGEERQLIAEVLAAGARHVRELMVPRTDVVFLDARLPVAEALRLVRDARHSRFPVIDGSSDDVVGFVHLRDLTIRPDDDDVAAVGQLAREVKRLPASKQVLTALSEMRRERHHLAVVVDEYGGTAGIVTLEDLIEELVGEIHDEYDAAPEPVPAGGTAPAEVDGRLNLTDFAEVAGFALPPGPYETLGGFLMCRLGRLPAVGDEVRLAGWRLVVSALDGRRVARVALASGGGTPVAGGERDPATASGA